MNRDLRTLAKLATIIAVTFSCVILTYFITSSITGHQLATASGNMAFSRWQEKFQSLTINAGILSFLCSLAWFVLTRWIFKINSSRGIGKRTVWAALAALDLIGCVAIPQFYSSTLGIKINFIVIAVFIIFFAGIGYWLLTIFTTPKIFKYTPLGARFFLARK